MIERKVVSCHEGFTFFIDKSGCVSYETGKHLSGEKVAQKLKITASAVSQSTKRSLSTVYFRLRYKNRALSPIEIMLIMIDMFGVKCEDNYDKFLSMFDSRVNKEIRKDARNYKAREIY